MSYDNSLNPIFKDVSVYLEDLFGLKGVYEVKKKDALKNYLKVYEYCSVEIGTVDLVLFHCLEKELPNIKSLKKHMHSMKDGWIEEVNLVLILSKISKYQRNLLLKEGISFIVPHNQMFIPILGLAINEHIRKDHEVDEYLSPGAQCVMYAFFENEEIPQTQLNDAFDYSKSSISRVLNELSDHGLIYMSKKGVSKVWIRSNGMNETWKKLKYVMNNPIKKLKWIKSKNENLLVSDNNLYESGESYLAKFAMLISPTHEAKAIYEKDWRLCKDKYHEVRKEDEGSICLEIWNHPLPLLKGYIHPVAIASTLLGDEDPRIQEAVEDIINAFMEDNQ